MLSYIIRRLLLTIPVLLGITLLSFTALSLTADPTSAILGQHATIERMAELRQTMGLNDPLIVQYGRYLGRLGHGDLGRSWMTRAPVITEIAQRFPHTVELTLLATLLSVILGLAVGVLSAVKQYSWFDHITMVLALVGVSMPIFWLGLLLIAIFPVWLGIFHVSGLIDTKLALTSFDPKTHFYLIESLVTGNWEVFANVLSHMFLPALALAAASTALIARMTRSTMLEVVRQDYVRTARAKGLSERLVVYKHALKNALIPVLTVVGLQFGALLGGAVLTETTFSLPGVGKLAVDAILNGDMPLVNGIVLLVAVAFVAVNLLTDLLYAWLDPRIHYS
ncbi:MAG: ABC transporter permease [Symbiobacteriia bacterium]